MGVENWYNLPTQVLTVVSFGLAAALIAGYSITDTEENKLKDVKVNSATGFFMMAGAVISIILQVGGEGVTNQGNHIRENLCATALLPFCALCSVCSPPPSDAVLVVVGTGADHLLLCADPYPQEGMGHVQRFELLLGGHLFARSWYFGGRSSTRPERGLR